MIHIHFWQDKGQGSIHMSLRGHADAAPKGADPVCAGATMLAYTVAQAVTFLQEQGQLAHRPVIRIQDGEALVAVRPKEDFYPETLHTFWVAQCGAHILAANFPGQVKLTPLAM